MSVQPRTMCGVTNRLHLLGCGQCCKLFVVTAIGMWGYIPVRITGVLVKYLVFY